MANATITAITGTQTGDFSVPVTFDAVVTGFDKPDVNLTARTENGIIDVDFTISGTEPTDTFMLMFTLPSDVEGSFEIGITGMVTPQGESTPEAVMANTEVVIYDTTANVAGTWGTAEYRDGGVIAIPITFAENVVAEKSIVEITSSEDLSGLNYRLVGEGTDFELIVAVPPDRSGHFSLDLAGSVFKITDRVYDQVVATAIKTVDYSTVVPQIVDVDMPATYTPGEIFDVKIAFSVAVTGLHQNNVQSVFLLEGAANVMGTPTPYRWTGAQPPDLQAAADEDLASTDWELLDAPPAGSPTPGENDFDDDGQWHGVSGQYFLVRWTVDAGTTGIFNMTLKENTLRGPIGS